MKLYNALVKKNNYGEIEDVILLKEGFSSYAFLFSGLWFLYHKMWREFLLLLLLNCFLVFLAKFLPTFSHISLEIAVALMIALNANYWLIEHLKKKNYMFAGMIFGENFDEAHSRFLIKNYGDNSAVFAHKVLR